LEPPKIIIQQYHDQVWLPERKRKNKLIKQGRICIQCGALFETVESLHHHVQNKQAHSIRFDKITYYPSKEPICRCSICTKLLGNDNIN